VTTTGARPNTLGDGSTASGDAKLRLVLAYDSTSPGADGPASLEAMTLSTDTSPPTPVVSMR